MKKKDIPLSMEKFATNFKIQRLNLGKSLYKVSKETQINYSFLWEIENLEKAPSFKTIDKLAEYFDIDIYEFFL